MRTFFKKLTTAVAVVACGVVGAQADTSVISDGVGGWTKLTAIPANPGDYYFVFVDDSQDLMLSYGEGPNQSTDAAYKTMVYRTSEDPAMNPAMLWTLTANDGGYSIKSAVEPTYYIQTEWNAGWHCRTHDNGGGSAAWYKWNIVLSDGKYTIENGYYPGNYVGPWESAAFANGQEVAANKTAAGDVGHFQLYAILKTAVDWMGNASESKPANLTYMIANSYAVFGTDKGWTGTDTQTRNSGNGFDGTAGFFEFCNWGATSWSGSLSQTISGLPAGKYRVRAAGQLSATDVVLTMNLNGSSVNFSANGDTGGNILQTGKETTDGSGVAGWKYASLDIDLTAGQLLVMTFSSSATASARWANFDNVELYCLGLADEQVEDLTASIISGADCTSNDAWPGNGRTTATGTYYDGTSRTYFTQNHENGAARSQTVTLPKAGCYLLRTIVRPQAAASYATISVGTESTTTRGIQTGSANIGNGWAYNDVYFATTSANESKTISIALSNVNNGREADCGEMHLYYIGQNADFVKDGTHRYIGTFASAPALELTDEVPVVDVTAATFTSGSSTVTFTNPNGLIFANADMVTASKNVIVNNACENFQLSAGHPFVSPTAFTATAAKYTMAAGELAGGAFATLMIPFEATTLPGTAYSLDQEVDLIDGNLRGTAVTAIAANSPVLATASGDYSGSSVTVPAVAGGATYTNGQLVGTYTATAAPTGSYVLQNHTEGEGVAFYLVGSARPTVGPFRAYIKAQAANAKALRFAPDGEADAIEAVSIDGQAAGVTYFTPDGRILSAPQQGINLVRLADGRVRKIFIK